MFNSSSADEFLTSASHRMTRRQLVDFLRNPLAIHEEFWVSAVDPSEYRIALSVLSNVMKAIFGHTISTKTKIVNFLNTLSSRCHKCAHKIIVIITITIIVIFIIVVIYIWLSFSSRYFTYEPFWDSSVVLTDRVLVKSS